MIGLFSGLFFISQATSLSFVDAFERAKLESNRIKQSQLEIRQSRTQVGQARAELFPEIDLFSNWQWRERPQSSSTQRTRNIGFRAEQGILQGLGRLASLKLARTELAIQENLAFEEELLLLLEVSEAYYGLASLQRESQSLAAQKDVLQKRVASLRERTEIGKSQEVDLLAARSQLAALEAEILENEFQESSQATRLCELIQCTEKPELDLSAWETWSPKSEEELFSYLDQHYLMQRAQEQVEQAKALVRLESAEFLPELDLIGQYSLDRSPVSSTEGDWSIQLNLNFNLFSGGADWYRRQGAVFSRSIAELERAQTERELRESIKIAYERWRRFEARLEALRTSAELARRNAREQQSQYDLGLVSSLDVLTALNQQLSSQRLADRAEFDWRQSYVELLIRSGRSLR